ncbi:MAG: MerR family transcriptional regulator [Oscillospiraceae bacterium]|nr:MerR family transcriptional regulator [Oscillospiraceae bacterium]
MSDTLSIYEFSKLSGVCSSTLRYWDDIGIFTPTMRNPDNNYRHYSTAQLPTLNFVTSLCQLGIPLKTIAKIRKTRDPETIIDLFDRQEHQLDKDMAKLMTQYAIIHARRELINMGMKADAEQISVVELQERTMLLWPRNEYKQNQSFLEPLAVHMAKAGDYLINTSFPIAGYHDNLYTFTENPGCPDHFLSLDPHGAHKRKAGHYLTGYCRGYYGDLGDLPTRMLKYANENALELTGPVYTMYLHEEVSTTNPSEYLAQSSIAIANPNKKTRKKR